jgi:hypothetical protein
MKTIFNKLILAVLTVALVLSAFPATGAFAQGVTPPQQGGGLTNEKLEKIWARQQEMYARLGKAFDGNDPLLTKLKERIAQAAANGKDVSAVQAALTAFESALKNAKPIYESMKGVVNSHQGFDANGKVTDSEKAKATLKEMRAKAQELKSAMGGTFKALRDAMQAFRKANKPAGGARQVP